MKRNNNKALYEKIMRNVSKQLKYTLNEYDFYSELSTDSIENIIIDNITEFQNITDSFYNQLENYIQQYPILKKYMKCLDPMIWVSPEFGTTISNFKYNKISYNSQRDIVNEWLDVLNLDSDGDEYRLCFTLDYDPNEYNFDTRVLAYFIYKFIDLYNLNDEGIKYACTSIYIPCTNDTLNQSFKTLLTIVKKYCDYVIKHIDDYLI